jgi:FkbM family methyltransferase
MRKLKEKIVGRLNWYKARFQVNNPILGRAVELMGNRVRMDGMVYSVATPQITRGHKSTLAFGLHEIEERELIRRWLPSDLPVLEFGGGLGVVSCLINKKLLDPRQHIVVEANPAMAAVLVRNRDINRCDFRVVNKAVAYDCDQIELNLDSEFVGSNVKDVRFGKTALVKTTTVEHLLTDADFKTAGIVCDIEGMESDIIKRELPILGERIRFIMAEMHPAILGKSDVDDLLADLRSMGFGLDQQIGESVFFSR